MAKLFISYSRKDGEIALKLADDLEKAGHSVWIDRKDIGGGSVWAAEIAKAIHECEYFLLLISLNSVQSDNVRKEVDLAAEDKKVFLPVVLVETEIPTELRYHLAGIQRIDFTISYNNGIDDLLNILSDITKTSYPEPVLMIDLHHLTYLKYDMRMLPYRSVDTISFLLHAIRSLFLERKPPPDTYGKTWILRASSTGRLFDDINVIYDIRTLGEVGILAGVTLEIINYIPDHMTTDIVIDMSPISNDPSNIKTISWVNYTDITHLLNDIWASIKRNRPPAFTYNKNWVLKDSQSGQLFENIGGYLGDKKDDMDVRRLDEVGIMPGMRLEVVPMRDIQLWFF